MRTKTKTWHIGECSYYGTWNIKLSENIITVTGYNYKTKEVRDIFIIDRTDMNRLHNVLIDVSNAFFGDKMMQWVKKSYEI